MKNSALLSLIGSVFLFIGCGTSQSPQPQETAKKVINTAKQLLDPCERNKLSCMSQCSISYPTENDDVKLKACIAKCYTIYAGCKTAEAAKKGYKKTKDFIQEQINN